MATAGVTLQGIIKTYRTRARGEHRALDGLSVEIAGGELFGLVGANGSGKTTLAKIMSGILGPDRGSGQVNGHDVLTDRKGVVASTTLIKSGGWTGLLYHSTVRDNVRSYGLLAGVDRARLERRTEQMLELLGLRDKAGELPWYLSAGERQKLCLAMAGMVRTPLVILDEPTTHLDPIAAADTRQFIKEILNRQRGQTVVVATHYLDEAQALCDRVAIVDRGRVVACGNPQKLAAGVCPGTVVEMAVVRCSDETLDVVRAMPGVARVSSQIVDPVTGTRTVRVCLEQGSGSIAELGAILSEHAEVRWMRTVAPSLSDAYFSLVGGTVA